MQPELPGLTVQVLPMKGETLPPFQGKEPAVKHAGYTGAVAALKGRAQKTARYLALLKDGPQTDQDAAQALGWPLASVNSIRNGLGYRVVFDSHQRQTGGRRQTTRSRWRLVQ